MIRGRGWMFDALEGSCQGDVAKCQSVSWAWTYAW
jgi:hypothetical protein